MSDAGITGLILAGGRARRMGGSDKGLHPYCGQPMIVRVIERLAPQVHRLLVNANRNLDAYAALGHPVVADTVEGFAGPLAGLHAGLTHCLTPLLVTAPCDCPYLPRDLVGRLRAALEEDHAEVAVARSAGRLQAVFALYRREVLPSLVSQLSAGQRKIDAWYSNLDTVTVEFPDDAAFININTPEDLQQMETRDRIILAETNGNSANIS